MNLTDLSPAYGQLLISRYGFPPGQATSRLNVFVSNSFFPFLFRGASDAWIEVTGNPIGGALDFVTRVDSTTFGIEGLPPSAHFGTDDHATATCYDTRTPNQPFQFRLPVGNASRFTLPLATPGAVTATARCEFGLETNGAARSRPSSPSNGRGSTAGTTDTIRPVRTTGSGSTRFCHASIRHLPTPVALPWSPRGRRVRGAGDDREPDQPRQEQSHRDCRMDAELHAERVRENVARIVGAEQVHENTLGADAGEEREEHGSGPGSAPRKGQQRRRERERRHGGVELRRVDGRSSEADGGLASRRELDAPQPPAGRSVAAAVQEASQPRDGLAQRYRRSEQVGSGLPTAIPTDGTTATLSITVPLFESEDVFVEVECTQEDGEDCNTSSSFASTASNGPSAESCELQAGKTLASITVIEIVPSTGCVTSAGCGGATPYCVKHVCRGGNPGDECAFATQCRADLVCGPFGDCQEGTQGDPCESKGDCPASFACVEGTCGSGQEGAKCLEDGDCNADAQHCVRLSAFAGSCSRGRLNESCANSLDCAEGLGCNGPPSLGRCGLCGTNADCGGGALCLASVCTNGPPPPCTSNAGCTGGKLCRSGGHCFGCSFDGCEAPGEQCAGDECRECVVDGECSVLEVCAAGHCVPL